jgi:hypothetical protein
MTDRPVHLDLRSPPSSHREPHGERGDARHAPDDDARQRFEHAMASDAPSDPPATPPALGPLVAALPSGPLHTLPPARQPSDRLAGLGKALSQLYVGDGSSGRREVRMELAGELLPGVSLSLYEDQGAWVAQFTCSDDPSRALLSSSAQTLAQEFADSLQRDAVWRVMTDDDEDLRLVEARARPAPASR